MIQQEGGVRLAKHTRLSFGKAKRICFVTISMETNRRQEEFIVLAAMLECWE